MESLQYQGWSFEFDKAATRGYYASHRDECTCASCRNFHKTIEEMPPDVKRFLEGFGIDIDHPIEQMSVIALKKENLVEQQVQYCVKGTAISEEGHEIGIGPVQIAPLNKNAMANHEMEEPYFGFALYNMYFHWTVEDDIDEVYPEQRSLMQKIKAFLSRAK
ncbi:MAG TPA: hypothetical protein PK438_08410 [Clostridia bacterium]|jgi:hypothetical protein|nr:MAG: hypothetical protein BWY35_00326 [Firmicutes bacterium ADurb.Bin248]HOG00402.1 hypothetical protein [Clostridia bacterium]HOS19298.1 hypothetical protein [Clostridia bacterium]HPK15806.1 hypothetical protein [Clostridia bacterium]